MCKSYVMHLCWGFCSVLCILCSVFCSVSFVVCAFCVHIVCCSVSVSVLHICVLYLCMCICMQVCVCVCVYVRTCVCVHVCEDWLLRCSVAIRYPPIWLPMRVYGKNYKAKKTQPLIKLTSIWFSSFLLSFKIMLLLSEKVSIK